MVVTWPKFGVPPSTSLVWIEPSALRIVPSPLPIPIGGRASDQVRVCVEPLMLLKVCAKPAAWAATYLPTLPLSAVLPSPVRSYDAANRTAQSFQFGTSGTAAKSRAAIHVEAGDDSAGTDALKCSKRTP